MKGNFNELIQSETPVLVDFYADWCAPCKMQSPILHDLSVIMGERVKIIKINVDKNQHLAGKFQVRGVPTLILFKHGNVVWRQSGVVDKNKLKSIIESHI